MAEPLKNMYNASFFADMTKAFKQVYPAFETEQFMSGIHDPEWEDRPLKARMRHITITLRRALPADYQAAVAIMREAALLLSHYNFQVIFFPDFVEFYGLDDWDASLPALELFTQYSSAEFAVRPFIVRDSQRMMAQMLAWAGHENHHVRRLASEGSRPRLPWAMALPDFKRDPAPILAVLEKLRDDPSEYVRRSVANNLNDIAKDHPDVVIDVLRRWSKEAGENTDWIVRRALRTLIKDGHEGALDLIGYESGSAVSVQNCTLSASSIQFGDSLTFAADIVSTASSDQRLLVDYVVYFRKANGTLAPKVFKLTTRDLAAGETLRIEKRHSFKPITTRVYYPGEHVIALKINGVEHEIGRFTLVM